MAEQIDFAACKNSLFYHVISPTTNILGLQRAELMFDELLASSARHNIQVTN
jgi:hypothetical protein